jgi:signal transduction histidine kinase
MTKASEGIARGNYQQVIPAQGHDEVARLADSFNRMAREVERSSQSQHNFLANVSHDLKTPLTSILGFSQAILEGAVHDEAGYRRAAQVINEEAGRMGELVRDLLDLARLDAGAAVSKRTPIAADELAQHCIQKLTPLATKRDVTMQLSTEPDLPLFHGDEERLEQALANLLDNAIKYTSPGGRVEVAVESLKGDVAERDAVCTRPPDLELTHRGWLAIRVKDNGPGIPREDLPHIFERFYRADKSRGGAKGSGLGLAIAKEVVEAHGGMISANSQPGSGSCFTILLPVD